MNIQFRWRRLKAHSHRWRCFLFWLGLTRQVSRSSWAVRTRTATTPTRCPRLSPGSSATPITSPVPATTTSACCSSPHLSPSQTTSCPSVWPRTAARSTAASSTGSLAGAPPRLEVGLLLLAYVLRPSALLRRASPASYDQGQLDHTRPGHLAQEIERVRVRIPGSLSVEVSLSKTPHPGCSRWHLAWLAPPSVCECVHECVNVKPYCKSALSGHWLEKHLPCN